MFLVVKDRIINLDHVTDFTIHDDYIYINKTVDENIFHLASIKQFDPECIVLTEKELPGYLKSIFKRKSPDIRSLQYTDGSLMRGER